MLLPVLTGCGYKFAGEERAPSIFGSGTERTIAVKEVENPTVNTRIGMLLRSSLRDELTRRNYARWGTPESSEYQISLRILRYAVQARVQDEKDQTLKSVIELRLEAEVTRRKTGSRVWESGPIVSYWTYDGTNERMAEERVTDLAMRELADRMAFAY